jgi:hypothetical protein
MGQGAIPQNFPKRALDAVVSLVEMAYRSLGVSDALSLKVSESRSDHPARRCRLNLNPPRTLA